jgi:hypothetical protein
VTRRCPFQGAAQVRTGEQLCQTPYQFLACSCRKASLTVHHGLGFVILACNHRETVHRRSSKTLGDPSQREGNRKLSDPRYASQTTARPTVEQDIVCDSGLVWILNAFSVIAPYGVARSRRLNSGLGLVQSVIWASVQSSSAGESSHMFDRGSFLSLRHLGPDRPSRQRVWPRLQWRL